ncbi:MAG: DnaJ domain-containing protein [Leptospiraceae bacterium]|nr:DnaJ domain-containing protein [Leptospiraceae bacterium]
MTHSRVQELPDYYKILNIPFGSSEEVIKSTFRSLAKLFHPDNPRTGNRKRFEEIHNAYKILVSETRNKYDEIYKKFFYKAKLDTVTLKENRIHYTTSMTELAKKGLLKSGLRTRDRKKLSGKFHDIEIHLKQEEKNLNLRVKLPLTARILCPSCMGSDIYCESCNGIGKYKATRFIQFILTPSMISNGRIFELELSRLRPDKFTHFKKKRLVIKVCLV